MKIDLAPEVLLNLLKGDMSYFNEFYEATKKVVFYNIVGILNDYQLSEDVLQETYIKFLENRKNIDPNKSILGYLFTISKNIALDTLKKRKRESSLDNYQESLVNTSDNYLDDEIFIKMKKILKEKEYQIVLLHIVEDLTHQEIANLLNKPLGTITWAYNNAMNKLRKGLKDYEG